MTQRKRGRPENPPGKEAKRGRPVRINPALAAQADILAKRNATTAPIEINRALRELLQRENLWPPAGPEQ